MAYHGFQIEYSSSTDVNQWSFSNGSCGGHFTTPNGLLTSPSYPDTYPTHADCIYTITQPNGTSIKLMIQTYDVGFGLEEDSDYLEIRDGDSNESPLLGKLWSASAPPMISTKNSMWLRRGALNKLFSKNTT